ncbi:TPA: hypothetical protein DEA21_02945, partial [Candidatus Uhrbacteria bacterium]|nr:hypothetical protein [Candidatus Uhrbacteria bacterium]HCU32118.1 hypothetical protein [Candidatus Uhrbacteria bacterium]
ELGNKAVLNAKVPIIFFSTEALRYGNIDIKMFYPWIVNFHVFLDPAVIKDLEEDIRWLLGMGEKPEGSSPDSVRRPPW